MTNPDVEVAKRGAVLRLRRHLLKTDSFLRIVYASPGAAPPGCLGSGAKNKNEQAQQRRASAETFLKRFSSQVRAEALEGGLQLPPRVIEDEGEERNREPP